ncbi:MAG: hypothetical protein IT486_10440 [Gammaproteobacteria bacterium]|nr:hypothetical protein [Gammaproteobacteria bacterium]
MAEVDVTFNRAMKFWWSLTWRTWVLMLPVMALLNVVVFWALLGNTAMRSGGSPDPAAVVGAMATVAPAYLVGLLLSVVAMVWATRWTLRTRWSDFRVQLVAPEVSA